MHQIGLIVYPGFQVLGLAMCAAFELANSAGDEPLYRIALLSEPGGLVQTSAGFAVQTEAFDQRAFDTLLVLGDNLIRPTTPGMLEFLRRASHGTRRLGSICTGAIALAQAGLLDGRRATTHWAHVSAFRKAYPNVKVEEDRIFINDGNVWTSAGMTAGIDLALALIEDDIGQEASRTVARKLVVYHRRSGGQSQHSALLELGPKSDRIQSALAYAKRNLRNELSVEELANAARLSPRQFSRVFRNETGQSPAKAVEHLRLEAARLMMEEGRHPIEVVAQETGFADRERMRRAFLRTLGQPPQAIRRNARNQ
jgi:transcriptional regulator GlxA family with amidase domain